MGGMICMYAWSWEVLLYGSETRIISEKMKKRLEQQKCGMLHEQWGSHGWKRRKLGVVIDGKQKMGIFEFSEKKIAWVFESCLEWMGNGI